MPSERIPSTMSDHGWSHCGGTWHFVFSAGLWSGQWTQPEAVPAGQLTYSWSTGYQPCFPHTPRNTGEALPRLSASVYWRTGKIAPLPLPKLKPRTEWLYWWYGEIQFISSLLRSTTTGVLIGLACWQMLLEEPNPDKCLTEFLVPTYLEVRKINSNYQVLPQTL